MIEKRGKLITCKYCVKQFKIENINEKQQWKDSNYVCPFCKEEWCILPKTERELKYLQEIYLKSYIRLLLMNLKMLHFHYF